MAITKWITTTCITYKPNPHQLFHGNFVCYIQNTLHVCIIVLFWYEILDLVLAMVFLPKLMTNEF